jgi:uncharacterized protein (DUF736 family)
MTNTNNTTNTNGKTDWKKQELGALWKRESKNGEKYLTGTLKIKEALAVGQEVQVIIFGNKSKKADNQPDFNVYVSEKNTGGSAVPTKAAVKPAAKPPQQVVPETDESSELL